MRESSERENEQVVPFFRHQAGSSPVSSISGFSVGSGRVDEAVDDFKVGDVISDDFDHVTSGHIDSMKQQKLFA